MNIGLRTVINRGCLILQRLDTFKLFVVISINVIAVKWQVLYNTTVIQLQRLDTFKLFVVISINVIAVKWQVLYNTTVICILLKKTSQTYATFI